MNGPDYYEVVLRGTLSDPVRAAFSGGSVESAARVTTVRCSASMLSDVLDDVQSFGLELIEVRRSSGGDVDR
jgi:hypothetical protein